MERMRKKHERFCDGIVYCSCCGRKLKSDDSFYYCPSGCVRRKAVEHLDANAMEYVRAVKDADFRESIGNLLLATDQERTERAVVEARRKVETVMDELQVFRHKPELIRMPDALMEWLDRPLPDRTEMIRQAEETARAENEWSIDTDEYFGVALPENPAEHHADAIRAVRWYIERIVVYEDSLEFFSTFNKWFEMQLYLKKEQKRATRWKRED